MTATLATPSSLLPADLQTLIQQAGTPANLAATISDGKWKLAPHLALLNRKLVELATGKIQRLIVQMPPRHGKSELGSRAFPAWYLGTFPERNVILTSATDDLAGEFSASSRDVLFEHGPSIFGCTVRDDAASKHNWKTTNGGSLRAAGVGSSIIGRGADLLIIDDYLKSHEEALSEPTRQSIHQWYHTTSSTRLSPRGSVLIIATRWHKADLIGQLLAEQERGGDQWEVVSFPAIATGDDVLGRRQGDVLWPDQFDAAWMEKRRTQYAASGYLWIWQALYQQEPPEMLGNEWRGEYFGDSIWFDDFPPAESIALKVMAVDPSLGKTDRSDYSAIVKLAIDTRGCLWVEADIQRRDIDQLVSDTIDQHREFRSDAVGLEVNGFQDLLKGIIEERSLHTGIALPIWGVNNSLAKIVRIRRLTPYIARGDFRFKRKSPGTQLLIEQLRGFPGAKHDDGPDALEMALRLACRLWEGVEN